MKDLGKPSFENESFKMWKTDKNDKEAKKAYESEGFTIKGFDGMDMKMYGFNTFNDKETNEVVFAYKIKDEKMLLYYANPKYLDAKRMEKNMRKELGFMFDFMSTEEVFEKMKHEKHMFKDKKDAV